MKVPLIKRIRAAFAAFKSEPRLPAGAVPFGRMYASARPNRSGGLGTSGTTSADAELATSLTRLRAASRQMVRDSAYAKRARTIVVNNVIGSGVGMQAQVMTTRDELNERVNSAIESAWCEWATADSCHTGGSLHFNDLERAGMGQVFEAGEVIIRKHYTRFGNSRIPLSLELIESERLADEFASPGTFITDNEVRMGVEVDRFRRPVAYWIRERHPGDIRARVDGSSDRYERVPAEDIFHLRIIDRWPQTRGEPWLHSVLKKIDEMNEYTGAEVSAARASAYYFATIETPDSAPSLPDEEEEDGTQVMSIEPLTIQALREGEKLNFHTPNRPNNVLPDFMRHMLRELAAGTGTSYESLSRDYSQSNYSSSRLALLDDRDLYKMLQQWWIRAFREPLHKLWLQQAVLAGVVQGLPASAYASDMARYEAVRFKPRGWSWVDPTKEVEAYKEAIKAGLTSTSDVIAQTADGRDIEDVAAALKRDAELFKAAGVVVDTDVKAERAADAAAKAPPQQDSTSGDQPARVYPIGRNV